MRSFFICLLLFLLAFSGNASGNQFCEIELVDGGVIVGELISHSKGVYKIDSKSLGPLTVNESEIRTIRFVSEPDASLDRDQFKNGPPKAVSPEIQSLQKSMMNDKDIMSRINSLQNDPKFQELLKDPEFMKAIYSGDLQTLMANPKFMELLNNPEIKEIQQKVLQKSHAIEQSPEDR